MPSIFRRTPDQPSDNYTGSHQGRGADYDQNFDSLPYRKLIWTLEETVLRDLIARSAARSVVDLACGTGRITEVLASALPGADVIGVDVAESMLARARLRVPDANFIKADAAGLSRQVPDESVDLLTAFRFFANADAPLRRVAGEAAGAAVRPGGYVLLNNHRNYWSPSYLLRRLHSDAAPGALNREILAPFLGQGFKIVEKVSLGVLPHNEKGAYFLPMRVAGEVERLNERRLGRHHAVGTDTIWFLQKLRRRHG